MEVDGGGEYQAPWINKNKYYLLQPYYVPVLVVLQASVLRFLFVCLFTQFLHELPTLRSFIFHSEYLGNLPKFREFLSEDSEDFCTLTWPRWGKQSTGGKKAPLVDTEEREHKMLSCSSSSSNYVLSSEWVRKVLTPSTPHSPTAFLSSQVTRDVNGLGNWTHGSLLD